MRTDLARLRVVAALFALLCAAIVGPRVASAAEGDAPEPAAATAAGAWRSQEIPPLSLAIPAEVDLVGMAIGVRPALLIRPARKDPAFTLRASVGILPGPEYFYLPISAGIRGVVVPKRRVHPYGGIGLELETFWVDDHPPFARPAVYWELGLRVDPSEVVGIFFEVAPELGLPPLPGFGLSLRLGVELALHRPG